MKNCFVLGTIVMMAAALSTGAVYAAPVAAGTHGIYTKTKTVSFSLRNDTKAEMKVKVGENEITLQPGKAAAVKLALGDRVVTVEDSPNYPAGTVLAVGRAELSGTTIALH